MWVIAKVDYYHKRTNDKIITEGKQYKVIRSHKDKYTLSNDNNKIFLVSKDVFDIMD